MAEQLDIEVRDGGSAKRVAKDVRDIGPAAVASERSVQLLNTGLGKLAGAATGILSAKVFLEGLATADDINDKLALVVGTTGELRAVQDQLFQSSQRTGTQLASNASLYAGLSQALGGLNLGQSRLLNLTELVSKSLVVQGKSAGDVSGIMARFVAQLQQGELSGRGLTGVLTQFPELTNAIAVGLGVTTQRLMEMGKQGQLSTEMVISGLERGADFINDRFNVAAGGLADSFNRAANALVVFSERTKLLDAITFLIDKFAKGLEVLGLATEIVRIAYDKATMSAEDFSKANEDRAIENRKREIDNLTKSTRSYQQMLDETTARMKRDFGSNVPEAMGRTVSATDRMRNSMEQYNAVTAQATAITTGFDASVRSLEAAASAAADQVSRLDTANRTMTTNFDRGIGGGGMGSRGGAGGGGGGTGGEQLGTGFAESFIQRQLSMFDTKIEPLQQKLLNLELKRLNEASKARQDLIDTEMRKVQENIQKINIQKQLAEIGLRQLDLSRITIQQVLGMDTSRDIARFQHGASFSVPGSGGPDSRLVKFWATPGERVNVSTRRQQRNQTGSGEVNVTNNFTVPITIQTPDTEGFKRSRSQLRLELLNDLHDVARKAGLNDIS